MATKIIFQDTPFGFNEIRLGTLTVYCGKVRIKGIEYTVQTPYLNINYQNGYCTLSFEVTDKQLANYLYRVVGKVCKEVAQSKLDEKWKWLNN